MLKITTISCNGDKHRLKLAEQAMKQGLFIKFAKRHLLVQGEADVVRRFSKYRDNEDSPDALNILNGIRADQDDDGEDDPDADDNDGQ